ncbi:MAG: hypothetical protein FOGNACKC_05680 [Anaerolineae bacterium]|nr:hypothetical protein [Anaerolineae bacterium]
MRLILLSLLLMLASMVSAPVAAAQSTPPVLAFYYAWFDQNTWASGQSVDQPAVPYNSADPATIERHVAEAAGAGIDALVQSWYGPQVENNQTETNFRLLLDKAQSRGLQAAVSVEVSGPFFADAGAVTAALSTLLSTHVQHPAYFRYLGQPVIFFWRQQRFSVAEWQAIRDQVDPGRSTLWIAEGTDLSYQAVFDGHHLYSIAWADSPAGQLATWGDRVRAYAADNGVARLWIATAMPGYDDTNLPRANAFAVPRRNGDFFRETWQGAIASRPDMVIITSFNEWPEGTQIEPSASYGNLYLDIARELTTGLKGAAPAAAIPPLGAQELPAAQADETPAPALEPPYIQTSGITNARSAPATSADIAGRLPEGKQARVLGKNAAGDWWQIDFDSGPAWVAAEVVEFVGDAAAVPVVEVEAAPVATASPTPQPASISVPAGGVNVRSGPGLNFELLGRLNENSVVTVIGKDETGEWWQVDYPAAKDGTAWVAVAVVKFSGNAAGLPVVRPVAPNATPTPSPSPTPTVPVIAGSVEALDAINVRAQPNTDGELMGGMYLGETADVLAISEDGNWWQIEFGGDLGWVAAEFVRFTGDKNGVPIFGLGTPTPTPGPTHTPAPTPTPAPVVLEQPTLAPSPTSEYQATSAALLAAHGTPEPPPTPSSARPAASFSWSDIPWGLLAMVIIAGFVGYQFWYRRRR